MKKCMIAAVADNYGIGIKGDLPWHLSEDLKYFKAQTKGFPVIMGRTTFFSIGKPLPGRTNIILNAGGAPIDGVQCVQSFKEAYELAEKTNAEKVFVIGGASVYKAAIDDMDELFITHVHTTVNGADVFFPEIDPNKWAVKSSSETKIDPESGLNYEFVIYERRRVR